MPQSSRSESTTDTMTTSANMGLCQGGSPSDAHMSSTHCGQSRQEMHGPGTQTRSRACCLALLAAGTCCCMDGDRSACTSSTGPFHCHASKPVLHRHVVCRPLTLGTDAHARITCFSPGTGARARASHLACKGGISTHDHSFMRALSPLGRCVHEV